MATVGAMVKRITERTPPRPVDGGIGGLTPAEDAELSDLLNGPHKVCECGSPGCGCPLITPKHLP